MNVRLGVYALVHFASALVFAASDDPIRWEPLGEPGGGGYIVSVGVSPHDARHLVASGDMLGAAVSHDGGDSWQPAFGFMTYEMASVTFHPHEKDVVWMGSCSGPYVSFDGGLNWKSRRRGMPEPAGWKYTAMVEKVLVDPKKARRLLAFGGTSRHWQECDCFGWIWRSDDAGENWTHVCTVEKDAVTREARKGANIVRAFWGEENDGKTVHLLADGSGWWTSRDGGATWEKRAAKGVPGEISGVTFRPGDPSTVWVSTHNRKENGKFVPGGVFKSTDGGESFKASDAGFVKTVWGDGNQVSSYSDVAVSPAAPDELYVCDLSWTKAVIYRSTDGGGTWRACDGTMDTACFAGKAVRLTLAPSVRGYVYGWNTEYILRSLDGGATWDDATAYRPDRSKPDHWRGRGWNGWCSTAFVFNPYRRGQSMALAMDAGRGWLSDDGMKSWRYTMGQTHPWLGGNAADFSKDGHIYVTTGQFGANNGIQLSADGGATWTTLSGEQRGLPRSGWDSKSVYGGVYVHPDDGRRAWVAGGGRLLATEDGGATWKPSCDLQGVGNIAGDPTMPGRFYVKARGGVYGTRDGRSFAALGLPGTDDRSGISCDAKGRVLVCSWRTAKGGGLWRFDPASRAWTRLLDEDLAYAACADPSDPKRIMLVTAQDPFNDLASGNGIWISADDGETWAPANRNLAMRRLRACAFDPFDPELVVAGQYGGGFVKARWPKSYRPRGGRAFAHTAADTDWAKVRVPEKAVVRVVNGDMAEGDGSPAGWSKGVRDVKEFHGAPASLRIDGSACSEQRLKGVSGAKIVKVSGWMKVDGPKAQVAIQCFTGDFSKNAWLQLVYAQDVRDWFRFEKTVTLPDWTVYADVKFLVDGAGRAWIDDIKGE